MIIKIDKKFCELSLDNFADQVYKELRRTNRPQFIFDFSETEWVSNEELVVFTSFLRYFKRRKIPFQLSFIERGVDITKMPERIAIQLIQLWDIWKLPDILESDYETYLGFGWKAIDILKKKHNYYPANTEIFNRYEITPFVALEKIENYQDKAVQETLTSVYKLNEATKQILRRYNSEHPFINNTISHIISKELYENFLDHFTPNVFSAGSDQAFMSLCLRTRLNKEKHSPQKIQSVLKSNFETEALPESKDFYFNSEKNEFKNQNVIQFSFLDFGKGIVATLTQEFIKETKKTELFGHNDSEILAFAFQYNSSRHGVYERNNNRNVFIPRGLFDVLSIVKMYKGMLVAKSGNGRVMYDFSNNKTFEEAITIYPQSDLYFPGNLISVYIPTENQPSLLNNSSIKPSIDFEVIRQPEIKYLSLFQIINEVRKNKKDIYSDLIEGIRRQLPRDNKGYTIFFSFRGYQYDTRIAKKALFFLLSDYDINLQCNVIIVHPPEQSIVDEINRETADLSIVEKTYRIHPLPLIYFSEHLNELKVSWMGVFMEEDIAKLNNLLSDQFSYAVSDFIEPGNVVGHVNYFDSKGNLRSHFPEREAILKYYREGYKKLDEDELMKLLKKNACFSQNNQMYLCHGNYYQKEFLEIIHLLNNEQDCDMACEILFRIIEETLPNARQLSFIGITTSSHKILESFVRQNYIPRENTIQLANYYSFDTDSNFSKIEKNKSYILICDVIATGFLAKRLMEKLAAHNAKLAGIGVLVNTIDPGFEESVQFEKEFDKLLIYSLKYPTEKFRRESDTVRNYLLQQVPIRINPFTNLAVTLNVSDTISQSILLTNDEFLDGIEESSIIMSFLEFNDVIHPYFFNTEEIIASAESNFLKVIFDKINLSTDNLNVFYPKESGIQYIDFGMLSNDVFKNHSVKYYQLERFRTSEGWRFPHATDYFIQLNKEKTILLLDDGSCTGDSILQMIDEIAFSDAKNIILVCLVGRISDHKREFFSRISQIRGPKDKRIPLTVYFACHWHIPTYYLDQNPNILERRWLEQVVQLPNTPERIRSLALTIQKAITPKGLKEVSDYKYVPRRRDDNLTIPKKEILRVREEIGKVIGYRFYRESFQYFDKMIKYYLSREREDRNKEMELLCATFLYEPYLYNKIAVVLPDIVDKIEEFVESLIFGNPKRGNRIIDLDKDLFYKWEKKDVIHLFFIVYKGHRLFEKLNDLSRFKKIITYIDQKDQSIIYVLFKLLAYFPLHKSELNEKNPGRLLHLIGIILHENELSNSFTPTLKVFRSFLSSLPTKEEYFSQLASIQEYYRVIKDSAAHKQSVLAHYDQMMVDLEVMKGSIENVVRSEFDESWGIITNFIESILAFSSTYPGFFLTKLSIIEGNTENSLRFLHGQVNELLYNLNQSSDFAHIKNLLRKIGDKILLPEVVVPQIFAQVTTPDAIVEVQNFISKNIPAQTVVSYFGDIKKEIVLDFPYYLLTEIILKEIVSNFRHSKDSQVSITIIHSNNLLTAEFSNLRSENNRQGGGHGLAMLEKLKGFPNGIIKYTNNAKETSSKFIQTIQIKTI